MLELLFIANGLELEVAAFEAELNPVIPLTVEVHIGKVELLGENTETAAALFMAAVP